ncbi:MAG: hypothetical protein FWD35_06770 [Oscillospiraceae bacterium]|nr:hypothetical protein [Oscillospiraceae bacterium]
MNNTNKKLQAERISNEIGNISDVYLADADMVRSRTGEPRISKVRTWHYASGAAAAALLVVVGAFALLTIFAPPGGSGPLSSGEVPVTHSDAPTEDNPTEPTETTPPEATLLPVIYSTYSLPFAGGAADAGHWKNVIDSFAELRDFYDIIFEPVWGKEGDISQIRDQVFFNEAEYNEEFFEERFLVLVSFGERTPDVTYDISSVTKAEDGLVAINIDRDIPVGATASPSYWVLVVEVPISAFDGMQVEHFLSDYDFGFPR